MPGPWEDYKKSDAPEGPWGDFQSPGGAVSPSPTSAQDSYKEALGPAPLRAALGFATGMGEGMNPLAIPHNLETLGMAAFEDQHSNPNQSGLQRTLEALRNAGNAPHLFPAMRIEDIAPLVRAGVRSAGELATLNPPDFQNKLAEEQASQKQFSEALPEWSKTVGEATPGIYALGQLGARGVGFLGGSKAAEKAANEARVAALGGGKAAVKKLMANDQIQSLGSQLKEDNIMGPLTSRPQIQENIEAAQQGYGQKIGDIVKKADATTNGAGIVPADAIINQAIDEVWSPLTQRSTTRAAADKIANEIDAFSAQHKGEMLTLEQLQKFKKDLSDVQQMFSTQGDNPAIAGYQKLYNVFNKGGENALNNVSSDLPPGNQLNDFLNAKQGYGANTTALKMIADRNARTMSNRMFSPTDYGMGGIGAVASEAAGDSGPLAALKGLGAAALNKGARNYGNQIKASTWQKLADLMSGKNIDPFSQAAIGTAALNYVAPKEQTIEFQDPSLITPRRR